MSFPPAGSPRSDAVDPASELVLTSSEWGMLRFLGVGSRVVLHLDRGLPGVCRGRPVGPDSGDTFAAPGDRYDRVSAFQQRDRPLGGEVAAVSGARSAFMRWWSATILLGIAFLAGTGCEWANLIGQHGLTISRNAFGTTYYTLVGFHALHVTVGVVAMLILLAFARNDAATAGKQVGVELVSWYWHFVDIVWMIVFTVVYWVGR